MDRAEERLALIELIDRDGRTRRALDVHAWPLRLGRALDNSLVLDDPHVAPHHATLAPDASGQLVLQVGDSRNGVQVGRLSLQAGQSTTLPGGDALLQIGNLRLRLRLAGTPVAAELLLARPLAQPLVAGTTLWAMALAWVAAQVGHRWLALDPGADLVQWLPWLLGLPLGLALWCGMWALGSKLFHHGFDFASHAAIALLGLLVFELLDALLPQAAAALGWPTLWQAHRQWATPLLGALVLRAHLRQLLPQRALAINLSLATLLAAGLLVTLVVNLRQQGRVFSAPYMFTLPPPLLQLDRAAPLTALDAALLPLRDVLLQRARDAAAEDAQTQPP